MKMMCTRRCEFN